MLWFCGSDLRTDICVVKCPCLHLLCHFPMLFFSPSVPILKVTSSFIPGWPFSVFCTDTVMHVCFPPPPPFSPNNADVLVPFLPFTMQLELIPCQSGGFFFLPSDTISHHHSPPLSSKTKCPLTRVNAFTPLLHRCFEHSTAGDPLASCAAERVRMFVSGFLTLVCSVSIHLVLAILNSLLLMSPAHR